MAYITRLKNEKVKTKWKQRIKAKVKQKQKKAKKKRPSHFIELQGAAKYKIKGDKIFSEGSDRKVADFGKNKVIKMANPNLRAQIQNRLDTEIPIKEFQPVIHEKGAGYVVMEKLDVPDMSMDLLGSTIKPSTYPERHQKLYDFTDDTWDYIINEYNKDRNNFDFDDTWNPNNKKLTKIMEKHSKKMNVDLTQLLNYKLNGDVAKADSWGYDKDGNLKIADGGMFGGMDLMHPERLKKEIDRVDMVIVREEGWYQTRQRRIKDLMKTIKGKPTRLQIDKLKDLVNQKEETKHSLRKLYKERKELLGED